MSPITLATGFQLERLAAPMRKETHPEKIYNPVLSNELQWPVAESHIVLHWQIDDKHNNNKFELFSRSSINRNNNRLQFTFESSSMLTNIL